MNTKGNKNMIILIAIIMAIVHTAVFLVIKNTVLSMAAYLFGLIGITMFCLGSIYMIESPKSYPWFAAFPSRIWQYLITEILLSALFVLIEILFNWSLPIQWFVFLQIIILAACLITLVLMKGGKEIIDQRGEEVKQKVAALRFVQADILPLISKYPEYEKELKQVASAIRYSDPMSHQGLAVYEEQIQKEIMEIESLEDGASIPDRCRRLLQQIADRNTRVKMMK